MITVLISGGLGNQMFQYAAGKALAKRLHTTLNLDLYPLEKKTQSTGRHYELGIFNIDVEKKHTLKGKFFYKARPFIQKHRPFFQKFGFFSDTMAILYQPDFETLKGNVCLSGYFQNERYFESVKEELYKDFTFEQPLNERNKAIADQIQSGQSVAVHIRRGDYITNKSAASNFVTCGTDYYKKSIEEVIEKIDNPVFYVFSEDFEWIKENITFGDYSVHYIDWNKGVESYIDMQLMSLCKHNIIANSSFSWWAAWLNSNPKKLVLAPGKWFQDEEKNRLLDDFYPKGWIKID